MTQSHKLIAGVVLGLVVGIGLLISGLESAICWTASITTLVAFWWVTEPISISATSLIPMAVFPLVGVLTGEQVASAYGSPLILLILGGFLLSAAMEKSGAHRRIALFMVNLFGGTSGRRLVFGFMAASAILSMWISNSATTLMLLPIVMAVVRQTDDRKLQSALLIGIAYAASIGGVGTPIGTPPNAVFMQVYQETTGVQKTFLQWMTLSFPIVAVMLPTAAFWLTRNLKASVSVTLPNVGKWRSEEFRTLSVFAVTALLWMTRQQPFGGWSTLTGLTGASDASIALMGALAMFLIPSGRDSQSPLADESESRAELADGESQPANVRHASTLLDWETAQRIPWGILLLFAGGVCIAKAFGVSGLSALLGQSLSGLSSLPVLWLVLLICLVVTFLTELTSNTATTTLLMPILAAVAVSNEIDPLILMVPATISASFAFMLPVATAPNAIVFGSQQLTVREMVREGIVLNLIGVVVVTAVCYWQFG